MNIRDLIVKLIDENNLDIDFHSYSYHPYKEGNKREVYNFLIEKEGKYVSIVIEDID